MIWMSKVPKPLKGLGPKIILGAFIIIICFSWLLWIFLEKFVDTENHENREMAAQPCLTLDNYGTFSEEYERYFNDNIPFRNNLTTLNSSIDYFIFNRSANPCVIVGDDNWLFYNNTNGGDPVGAYKGTNLLSDEQLQEIAQNCLAQRDFLAAQGKEFVIFIAPNKERIYSEYMPRWYGKPADNYQALQVVNYLRENTDLRVVYPYEELMEAKQNTDYNIYSKTDTHWNYIGGYIGASALLRELGIELPDITDNRTEITVGDKTSGDLAEMLNLSDQLTFADRLYTVSGYDTHNMQVVEENFFNVFSYTAENADLRKIYIVRDSFSSHMREYIGSQFKESYLRHIDTYTYEDFVNQDPDILVYETVERYVDGLGSFSIQ